MRRQIDLRAFGSAAFLAAGILTGAAVADKLWFLLPAALIIGWLGRGLLDFHDDTLTGRYWSDRPALLAGTTLFFWSAYWGGLAAWNSQPAFAALHGLLAAGQGIWIVSMLRSRRRIRKLLADLPQPEMKPEESL